jgi:hypothetical protein
MDWHSPPPMDWRQGFGECPPQMSPRAKRPGKYGVMISKKLATLATLPPLGQGFGFTNPVLPSTSSPSFSFASM